MYQFIFETIIFVTESNTYVLHTNHAMPLVIVNRICFHAKQRSRVPYYLHEKMLMQTIVIKCTHIAASHLIHQHIDVAKKQFSIFTPILSKQMNIAISYDNDVDVFIKMYCMRHRNITQKNPFLTDSPGSMTSA